MTDWKPRYDKIIISLIPATSFGSNVRTEHPQEWGIIKHLCYRRAGYCCEICGERGTDQGLPHDVECHELWDYHYDRGIQKLIDFVALCPLCHRAHHLGFAETQGALIPSLERIKRINKIEDDRFIIYLWREAKVVWNTCSRINWKLDVSFISKFIKLYGKKKTHKASWAIN